MMLQPKYTFNNFSSNPFDDWFDAERGTELEDDVNECVEDDYSEDDYE